MKHVILSLKMKGDVISGLYYDCPWIVFCKMIKNVDNIIENYPEIYVYVYVYVYVLDGMVQKRFSGYSRFWDF